MAAPVYLTTREVAELLRIKERKVYELAGSGGIPVSRVTGKLLFPRDLVERWLHDSVEWNPAGGTPDRRPAVLAGSHDPLLDWALRESGSEIASYFDGSMDGLHRIGDGRALACGVHIPGDGADEWNVDAVRNALPGAPVVLVEWARRRQGLILRCEDHGRLGQLRALAGARVVQRQPGAGSRVLFERLLAGAGVDPDSVDWRASAARTETDVAMAVASGEVDAGFGIEAAARQMRLAFVPLAAERFDLVIWRRAYFDPPLQRLLRFCAGSAFHERAAAMGGYALDGHGQVRFNGA